MINYTKKKQVNFLVKAQILLHSLIVFLKTNKAKSILLMTPLFIFVIGSYFIVFSSNEAKIENVAEVLSSIAKDSQYNRKSISIRPVENEFNNNFQLNIQEFQSRHDSLESIINIKNVSASVTFDNKAEYISNANLLYFDSFLARDDNSTLLRYYDIETMFPYRYSTAPVSEGCIIDMKTADSLLKKYNLNNYEFLLGSNVSLLLNINNSSTLCEFKIINIFSNSTEVSRWYSNFYNFCFCILYDNNKVSIDTMLDVNFSKSVYQNKNNISRILNIFPPNIFLYDFLGEDHSLITNEELKSLFTNLYFQKDISTDWMFFAFLSSNIISSGVFIVLFFAFKSELFQKTRSKYCVYGLHFRLYLCCLSLITIFFFYFIKTLLGIFITSLAYTISIGSILIFSSVILIIFILAFFDYIIEKRNGIFLRKKISI